MTYEEKFQELRLDFIENSEEYLNAEKKISIDCFIDKQDFFDFIQKEINLNHAIFRYRLFLINFMRCYKLPDDEFVG